MLRLFKKITKYFSYLVLVILILPVLCIGILQIPKVQNYAVEKVVRIINEKVGSSVSFSKVRITTLSRIRFDNLLVIGIHNDTILYSKKTIAVIPLLPKLILNEKTDEFFIRRLQLEKADLVLASDSLGVLNFQFLIDYLERGIDTSLHNKPVPFGIKDIRISDSRYFMRFALGEKQSKGINFSDLELNNFNVHVRDLIIFADTIKMDIKQMTFIDKSGFEIENMEAKMHLCKTHLFYDEAKIKTPKSNINANRLRMTFNSFRDYGSGSLFRKVKFDMDFNESKVNTSDLGYFASFFWDENQTLLLSGSFTGPLANFKSNNLKLQWGQNSFLSGDFSLNGLPAIHETFLIFELKDLSTNTFDITSLNLPGGRKISLPENLKKLESLRYKGNFTGFFNDFVAHGRLTSNLGEVYTDLSIVPDTLNSISFSGNVKTNNFSIGAIAGDEELIGDISLDLQIKGSLSKESPLQARISGNVSEFFVNQYNYRDISINGEISNKRFSGQLNVNDPNLNMEFTGLIDLGIEPWLYDFSANVIDANLYALHLATSDPNYHASFLMNAKARGKSLDDLNGEVRLVNSLFSKTDKQIQVYDLNIFAENDKELNEIIIRSDLLDADITGKFQMSKLKDEFLNYLSNYFPALTNTKRVLKNENLGSQVNFSIDFKRTRPFFDFFFPDFLVSENSQMRGIFMPGDRNLLKIDLVSPEVMVKKNILKGVTLNIFSEDSVLSVNVGSHSIIVNDRIDFENFTLQTTTKNNSVDFTSRWLNWDTVVYKGNLSGNLLLANIDSLNTYTLSLNPSSFTFSDSVWNLNAFKLQIDSSGVFIDSLQLNHKKEYMVAIGKLSDNEGDSLRFGFHNFDMSNLNFFTRNSELLFEGVLNGSANLTGNGNSKLFFSSLSVSDLMVNGEELGNLSVNSIWDNSRQALNIDASSNRGNLTVLKLEGDYYPDLNGKMDFRITLNKLRTNLFNPFVKSIFSDMIGMVSGNLELTGTSSKPSLDGKLKLQKNYLTINYLNTRYNFSAEVDVVNNNFLFDNIEIFDADGNSAFINGMIRTEYLKDIFLNINISMNNLLCLNTRSSDNPTFYGTAYASGTVRMKGIPSELKFDIDASTGKNTHFFIPVTQSSEVEKYSYIKLIVADTTDYSKENTTEDYKVNLSGIQMNFNMDVTPDAEVQLVFDSKIGDIIKARGKGKMKMSINTLGTFDLVGEYIIEKGDYLFTLQNVINKKLSIESGSTLRWTGDPFNAFVDITTVYRTKASLADLDPADSSLQDRVTVDCKILLSEQLMSPTVKYNIELPYTNEDVRSRVLGKINTEEEMARQVFYLLVLGRFSPMNNSGDQSSGGNIAGANASELLSNQLSNWLSQISSEIDIDVNYRPESGKNQELEVALSKELLNNRLSINGSVDMKSNATAQNASSIVGDVDIEYKLNPTGNVRLRAYNHSNDNISTTISPYTQGFGIFYNEEFNTLSELLNKYWEILSGKRKKKNKTEAKTEGN